MQNNEPNWLFPPEFLSEMLSEADIEYMIDEDMMDIMDLGSLIRNKKGIKLVFRLQSSVSITFLYG